MIARQIFAVLLLVCTAAIAVRAQGVCINSATETCGTCPNPPATPGDRRPDKNTLTMMAYNVKFLFNEHPECTDPQSAYCIANPSSCTKSIGSFGCISPDSWPTLAHIESHLDAVAGVIRELNPDVVSFEEVENCRVLERLNGRLSGLGYKYYLVKGTDSVTLQNVALLTRVDPTIALVRANSGGVQTPVPGSQCGDATSKTESVSKSYYTEITVNNVAIRLMGLHFASEPLTPSPCRQREGQSLSARYFLESKVADNANKEIVVFGDFNDYDGATLDVADSVPLSRALSFMRQGGPDSPASTFALTNIHERVAKQRRFTSGYSGGVTAIDHMLLSPGMNSRLVAAYVYHAYPFSANVSDHWPVVGVFDFGAKTDVKVRGITFSDRSTLVCGTSNKMYKWGFGCQDSRDAPVTSSLGVPLQTFSGSTASLFAIALTGTNIAYTWDMGDGSPKRCGPQIMYDYAAKGTYTVTLTASNSVTSATSYSRQVTVSAGKGFADTRPLNCSASPSQLPAQPSPAAVSSSRKATVAPSATRGTTPVVTGGGTGTGDASGQSNDNPTTGANSGSGSGGVSVGAIAGGVVGGLAAIGGVAGVVIYFKMVQSSSPKHGRMGSQMDVELRGHSETVNVLHNPTNSNSYDDIRSVPPPKTAPKPPGGKEQRANYAYAAQNADELDLEAGDEITVTKVGADGWNAGRNKRTNKTGVFPATYAS
eukprot:Opistho-2@33979